jgi:hypothetical protein
VLKSFDLALIIGGLGGLAAPGGPLVTLSHILDLLVLRLVPPTILLQHLSSHCSRLSVHFIVAIRGDDAIIVLVAIWVVCVVHS